MSSFLAKITCVCIKAFTYRYRKNHLSLSQNIKLKNVNYNPKHFDFELIDVNDKCKIEKLSPKNQKTHINIVQFHGGGACQGMNKTYHKVAEKLAKQANATVYTIDYIPNKNYVYPILHDICFEACEQLESILNFDNVVMIGDSYGANLLMSTCHKLQNSGFKMPRKIICISPYVDLANTGESYKFNCYKDPTYSLPKNQDFEKYGDFARRKSSYIGNANPTEPYLSPAYLEYKNFPPVLIQVGSYETDLSDSIMLKSALEKHENQVVLNIYEGLFHDFQYFAWFLKESRDAWKSILNFIRQ